MKTETAITNKFVRLEGEKSTFLNDIDSANDLRYENCKRKILSESYV